MARPGRGRAGNRTCAYHLCAPRANRTSVLAYREAPPRGTCSRATAAPARNRNSAWSAGARARSACPAKRQPCPVGRTAGSHAPADWQPTPRWHPSCQASGHNASRVPAALVRRQVREAHSRGLARGATAGQKPGRLARPVATPGSSTRLHAAVRVCPCQQREIDMRPTRRLFGTLAIAVSLVLGVGRGPGQGQLQDRLVDLCRLDALGLGRGPGHRQEVGRQVRHHDRVSCRSTTTSN